NRHHALECELLAQSLATVSSNSVCRLVRDNRGKSSLISCVPHHTGTYDDLPSRKAKGIGHVSIDNSYVPVELRFVNHFRRLADPLGNFPYDVVEPLI